MPSMNIAQLFAGQCISWVALKMQHTTRLLSGIGRDVSGSRPQPCMRWLGTPPAHDRPIQAQLRHLRRGLFLIRREGPLERPPFRDAANGLASASHYLGLRGAFATLSRQG